MDENLIQKMILLMSLNKMKSSKMEYSVKVVSGTCIGNEKN